MRELKDVGFVLVTWICFSIFFYHVGYNNAEESIKCPKQEQKKIIKDTLPELTKENVLKEIIKNDIKHPLIVYRQVLKETMHLQCSNCCLNINNLWGFTSNKMLIFEHWTESVKFYKQWQSNYKEGDYYEHLIRYWGAPNMLEYCRTLKQIEI